MIMNVKQDLKHKFRLVAGGHLIDALDHYIYSTTVKSINMELLQVIAHNTNLEILCGDFGNAYVSSYTNERVYAITGEKFGKAMKGSVVIIVWDLYGLRTSSERWHVHLADKLRGLISIQKDTTTAYGSVNTKTATATTTSAYM